MERKSHKSISVQISTPGGQGPGNHRYLCNTVVTRSGGRAMTVVNHVRYDNVYKTTLVVTLEMTG